MLYSISHQFAKPDVFLRFYILISMQLISAL